MRFFNIVPAFPGQPDSDHDVDVEYYLCSDGRTAGTQPLARPGLFW